MESSVTSAPPGGQGWIHEYKTRQVLLFSHFNGTQRKFHHPFLREGVKVAIEFTTE
jgi:hypothetical protein